MNNHQLVKFALYLTLCKIRQYRYSHYFNGYMWYIIGVLKRNSDENLECYGFPIYQSLNDIKENMLKLGFYIPVLEYIIIAIRAYNNSIAYKRNTEYMLDCEFWANLAINEYQNLK